MDNEEKRSFKRYKSQSECEVRLGTETCKGRIVDYSADGACAIFKKDPHIVQGALVDLKIFDSEMVLGCEIAWVKDSGDNIRVGFRRVDNLKGPLRHFRLSDILIGIQRSTRTGVLTIESGSISKKIFIKNGDIVFATSNNEDDRLGEVLLKEGKITLEEYNQSSNLLLKTGQRLGKILVELGCFTPKELFHEVRHHIEEIILSLFTIEEGTFEFEECPVTEEELITLHISAANIICKGIKRVNSFVYIKQMSPPINAILNLSQNPLNIFQDLSLEEPDKKILSYVNGMYSIKTILALSPVSNFETLKTICALLSTGLIKVKKEDEPPVELPVEVIFGETEEEVTIEFVKQIEEMHHKCETLGYYDVLGVNKEATAEEIKKAYYRLTKQFHPDRHFALPSHDMKGKLTKIFSYTTDAFETLSDPSKRMRYNLSLSLEAAERAREAARQMEAAPAKEEEIQIKEPEVPEIVELAGMISPSDAAEEGEGFREEVHAAEEETVKEAEIPGEAAEEIPGIEVEEPEEKKEESEFELLRSSYEDKFVYDIPDEGDDYEKAARDLDIELGGEKTVMEEEVKEEPAVEEAAQQPVPEKAGIEAETPEEKGHVLEAGAAGEEIILGEGIGEEPQAEVVEAQAAALAAYEETAGTEKGPRRTVEEPVIAPEETVGAAAAPVPSETAIPTERRRLSRVWFYVPVAIVAAITIIIVLFVRQKDTGKIPQATAVVMKQVEQGLQLPVFRDDLLREMTAGASVSLPPFRDELLKKVLAEQK